MRALSPIVLAVFTMPATAHSGSAPHVHPHADYLVGLALLGVCLGIAFLAGSRRRRSALRTVRARTKR